MGGSNSVVDKVMENQKRTLIEETIPDNMKIIQEINLGVAEWNRRATQAQEIAWR
jgi:hypothetical protein